MDCGLSCPDAGFVVSFVFVIGLLLTTLWFVRSRGIGMGPMNGQGLRVVNSLRLGGKHRLDVVEYGGRRLLLGVAPSQITLLDNQSQDSAVASDGSTEASDNQAGTSVSSNALSFAGQLRQFMQRDE